MYTTWQQNNPDKPRRSLPRTKNGCLTCRRRKVRCNEQRPRCHHCTRLQLDCTWNPPATNQSPTERDEPPSHGLNTPYVEPNASALQSTEAPVNDLAFNELFNYASFMWDDIGSLPSQLSPNEWNPIPSVPVNAVASNGLDHSTLLQQPNHLSGSRDVGVLASPSTLTPTSMPETELTNYFVRSDAPPILAPVETRFRWSTMRKQFAAMSSTSRMVHYAVMAFSALQLEKSASAPKVNYGPYYDRSKQELSQVMQDAARDPKHIATELQHILAVLFLLSYIDLVTDRVTYAHSNLREAYTIFHNVDRQSLSVSEKRLISWIRLLDARAVSAGGEGLFLADDDESVIAMDFSSPNDISEAGEDDVEDVLSDMLSKPAVRFFHQVQSFMGRISRIDQWHRPRGTVEDETEVMAIASKISKDITALYEHRPSLMDHAVAGRLQEPHVSRNLAIAITRSMRTYLANYHASFVHLHRVAYRHLPRTTNVSAAVATIRNMARLMSDAQRPEESLPVNMLWPLLMWGCEEDDLEERAWIIEMIRKMENVASNAKITADVLEEVQRRQDATKQRADIRTVMHDIFKSCFAIV